MEKLLKDTVQFLGGAYKETKAFLGQMVHSMADMHIDPNESGNLYNALNSLEGLIKEFLAWLKEREEQAKKEEEAAKEKAKNGKGINLSSMTPEDLSNFLKSDGVKKFLSDDSIKNILNSDVVKGILNSDIVTNLISSEFVSSTLKQYSNVIKENADLIQKIAPKELADKLLSFAVPAEKLSNEIKNPQVQNKPLNRVVNPQTTVNPEYVAKNPKAYKALYDQSKNIVDKNPTLTNKPQAKTAAGYMEKIGFELMKSNPDLRADIQKDFKNEILSNPNFRNVAVSEARKRLSTLNADSFAKLPKDQRMMAENDVKTVLTGMVALNVTPETKIKDVDAVVNKNMQAFLKDPAKGLSVLSNRTVAQNAAQRMAFTNNNPKGPRPGVVAESPIAKFDDNLKADMLKSGAFRNEKIQQAQAHLQHVLSTAGVNTKEGIDRLPKEVQNEIAKDVNTIFYGQTVNEALKKQGKDHLSTKESVDNYLKDSGVNGVIDKATESMFKTPNANFAKLVDNKSLDIVGKGLVNTNNKEFSKATSLEPKETIRSTEFSEATKTDMLKSREVRAESVINARKNLKDMVEKYDLTNKESYDKLPKEAKEAVDNSIKTIGFAYAAEKGLASVGRQSINSPDLQKQMANSKGMNWAAENTLEEFYKNPQQGLRNLYDNKYLQKTGEAQMADFKPEISNIAKNDPVPNKSFLVNQNLGVQNAPKAPTNAPQQKRPAPIKNFDDSLKRDMLRSPGIRAEMMRQATAHVNSILAEHGNLNKTTVDKLPESVRKSLDNDMKTIAFGVAANEALALGNKDRLSDPKAQEELMNSKSFNAIAEKTEHIYQENFNAKEFDRSKFEYKNIKEQLKPTVEQGKPDINNTLSKEAVKNEQPLENFDNNLKTDMLKSQAYRAEKINEASMHLKNTFEQNNIKSNDDYAKAPKAVRESIDRDIKTIAYGHITEEALKRNGVTNMSNESIQNKYVNNKTIDNMVNSTLDNFNENPMGKLGSMTNPATMAKQAQKLGNHINGTLSKDVFNDDMKKQMLGSQEFRNQKISEASKNIKDILDKTGPMTQETYDKLSPDMKDALDTNMKTALYGQYANAAIRMTGRLTGKNEITDPKMMDQMLNSKALDRLVDKGYLDYMKDPNKATEIVSNEKEMHNIAKSVVQTNKEAKDEFFDIMDPEALETELESKQTENPEVSQPTTTTKTTQAQATL